MKRLVISILLPVQLYLMPIAPLALGALCAAPAQASSSSTAELKYRKYKIAGLNVAVWKPEEPQGKLPLVIFSHGSGGKNTKSSFITAAIARAGYLVIAPNHKDSTLTGISLRPDFTFKGASDWDDKTFECRRHDIVNLIDALHQDQYWNEQIDWSNLALTGHSLGGYTALGLCGAWPSWKIDGVKAVLGLAPYCEPFLLHGSLGSMNVPVMYQDGTRDNLTRALAGDNGAYAQSSKPAYLVDFAGAGHLAWTNFKHNRRRRTLINKYSIAFLNKYLKGEGSDLLDTTFNTGREGVAEIEKK